MPETPQEYAFSDGLRFRLPRSDIRRFIGGNQGMTRGHIAITEPPGNAQNEADCAEHIEDGVPAELQNHPGSKGRGNDRSEIKPTQEEGIPLRAFTLVEPAFHRKHAA